MKTRSQLWPLELTHRDKNPTVSLWNTSLYKQLLPNVWFQMWRNRWRQFCSWSRSYSHRRRLEQWWLWRWRSQLTSLREAHILKAEVSPSEEEVEVTEFNALNSTLGILTAVVRDSRQKRRQWDGYAAPEYSRWWRADVWLVGRWRH